ncbi:hypothetical protein D922_00758 [Enterococcus faecalis 06-MB-DW-09]|nr:hypothetical protein D922_00758 [Enterococcus faecalis 06-MB-DW-09]
MFLKHCSINNGIAFHFFEQKEKQAKFFSFAYFLIVSNCFIFCQKDV